MFNKYKFLENLQEQINNLDEDEDKEIFLHEELNREVIYFHHCWDICKALNGNYFEDDVFGLPTNISQHAYNCLYEYVYDNLKL